MTRRDLTAMARTEASRPLRLLLEHNLINSKVRVLDYGSGRGADVDHLVARGIKCRGWDPTFAPNVRRTPSDVVTLTYVLNVIEKQDERIDVLKKAWQLTTSLLAVSVRLEDERDESHIKPYSDGWLTSRKTFQKFYEHSEFAEWLENILGTTPVTAGPGIFLLFREEGERERYLAKRYAVRIPVPRIRLSDRKFIDHRESLEPLITFFYEHGRLPKADEIPNHDEIVDAFGTIGRAFRVVETVTDREEWLSITEKRRIDILIYLALRQFEGPFKLSNLDRSTQLDVRSHHKTFALAMEMSTRLLFSAGNHEAINLACRSSTIGKLTPSALYLHIDSLQHAPAILKIYEACAKRIIGEIPEANLIKLHRDTRKVSYLSYPQFDTEAHPELAESFIVDLSALKYKRIRYDSERNVPILHRKETFLHKTDYRFDTFAKLTKSEEEAGLLESTSEIGYRDQWRSLVTQKGFGIHGNSLLKF